MLLMVGDESVWKWIILGVIALVVAYFVWSFMGVYRGMFTVKHYRKVAAALERIRQGATERLSAKRSMTSDIT